MFDPDEIPQEIAGEPPPPPPPDPKDKPPSKDVYPPGHEIA